MMIQQFMVSTIVMVIADNAPGEASPKHDMLRALECELTSQSWCGDHARVKVEASEVC